ncbi:protein transport protein S31, partial [Bonamia ostreae]
MICKKIKTPANIAWSPSQHKSLIAAGTSQGLINDDFQSFSKLEIFSANNTQQQALVSIPTSSSFSCLAWGAVDQGSTPMGLICGGTDDGSLSVWNPSLVLDSATEQPLSAIPEKDFSRVAQFDSENLSPTVVAFGNGEQSHSIAVASSSGEHISIFDLQSLGEAASLPIRELPSSRQLASRVKSGVEALRWNKRVPQILAVGNSNGSTVIWDLRHNKIAMALKAKSFLPFRNYNKIFCEIK